MKHIKTVCLILVAAGFYQAAGHYDNALFNGNAFFIGKGFFIGKDFFIGKAWADEPSKSGRKFLGSYQDWDAFTEKRGKNETACYTISVPKEKLPKGAKRGTVYMMVTNWPKAKIVNQVSVIMGAPLKKGSTVAFAADKHDFKMFVDGDRAWAWDSKQDSAMTDAMKNASTVVIKGTSSHGALVTDRYSLAGFTAAHNAITKACD